MPISTTPAGWRCAWALIGLFHILTHARATAVVVRVLALVGRMPLSVYVSQTIVCITVFYGVGFAQFGTLEHHQLLCRACGSTPCRSSWLCFGCAAGAIRASRGAASPSGGGKGARWLISAVLPLPCGPALLP
ncbi:MAG: DUF418 domain-containing protein [Alphaproteobacteria bacterium]|nr:DUF418 domain-containing protein [Alphaproteobacteria bacterium]